MLDVRDSGYRFGFNGQEKDDEITGTPGSHLNFGARIYDSRIGRWLSVDPEFKRGPSLSPYNFAFNSPVQTIDSDGKWPISTHYNMTFDAIINLGYDEEIADIIAHGASTVADHPDVEDDGVSISGAADFWASITFGAGEDELNYRKGEEYQEKYAKYKNSQSDSDPRGLKIHATRSVKEEKRGFTKKSAITRTIKAANKILGQYKGADLSKLSKGDLLEIGVALHMLQDVSVHEGATWAKGWFKGNDHNALTMDAFGFKSDAVDATKKAVSQFDGTAKGAEEQTGVGTEGTEYPEP